MPKRPKLTKTISLKVFENNYWYALELKAFAISIGVPTANRMRKEQLEAAIKQFLEDGKLVTTPLPPKRKTQSLKDYDNAPLSSSTRIIHYSSNTITKTFIQEEAKRRQPGLKKNQVCGTG